MAFCSMPMDGPDAVFNGAETRGPQLQLLASVVGTSAGLHSGDCGWYRPRASSLNHHHFQLWRLAQFSSAAVSGKPESFSQGLYSGRLVGVRTPFTLRYGLTFTTRCHSDWADSAGF